MSISYDSEPDSKDVINENKNTRKIRLLFWQSEDKKSNHNKPRRSDGVLLCSKCPSAGRYGSTMEIGYDPESKSIVKICSAYPNCDNIKVLETDIEDDIKQDTKESEISPGGSDKVQPLLIGGTLNVGGNRDRAGNRMPTGLSSNRGLDENTIHDISSAFGSSPSSGGPTLNERLNWGRKKFIS